MGNRGQLEVRKRRRFFWGVLLAWIPTLPLAFSIVGVVRDFSSSRATGLGAVAGGLAEAYLTLGVVLTFVCEATAIVLLIRAFSRGQIARSLVAILSIGLSAVVIVIFGLFVWFFFFKMPHAT